MTLLKAGARRLESPALLALLARARAAALAEVHQS
jgi:hypothetical protein